MHSVEAVKKYLKTSLPEAKVEDAFRVRQEGDSYSCLVRIPTEQAALWMKAKSLPFAVSPLGEHAQAFRVIWDRDCGLLSEITAKYSARDRFMGPVLTQKGIGARFNQAQADAAKVQSGLPAGESYLILGVPHDMREPELQAILQDTGWTVTILPQTRRVRQRRAQYVLKAPSPPPKTILKLKTGQEVTTLQIQPHKPHPEIPKQATEMPKPSTWLQVAQRALGTHHDTGEIPAAGRKHARDEEADDATKFTKVAPGAAMEEDTDDSEDPFRDAYVEHKPNTVMGKRMDHLEHEMGQVRENLQQILKALSGVSQGAPCHPQEWHVTMAT